MTMKRASDGRIVAVRVRELDRARVRRVAFTHRVQRRTPGRIVLQPAEAPLAVPARIVNAKE
jgi:hypothetical protein